MGKACVERTTKEGGVMKTILSLWKTPEIVRKYRETGDEKLRDAANKAFDDNWNARVATWHTNPRRSQQAAMVAAIVLINEDY